MIKFITLVVALPLVYSFVLQNKEETELDSEINNLELKAEEAATGVDNLGLSLSLTALLLWIVVVLVTTALSATPTLGVVGPFSRSDYASDIEYKKLSNESEGNELLSRIFKSIIPSSPSSLTSTILPNSRKLVPVSKRKIEFTKPNVNSRKTSKPNQNRTPAKPSQIKKSTKEIGTNLPVTPIKPTKEPNQKTSKLKPNPRPFKPNQEEKFSKISPFSRNGRIPENKNREQTSKMASVLNLIPDLSELLSQMRGELSGGLERVTSDIDLQDCILQAVCYMSFSGPNTESRGFKSPDEGRKWGENKNSGEKEKEEGRKWGENNNSGEKEKEEGRKWGEIKNAEDNDEDCEVFKCTAVSTGFQLVNLYRRVTELSARISNRAIENGKRTEQIH
ncbi:uncharacterized protein LOC111715335 [Eurytemora carolleeae]|uniref:uncharacterized protein LOC111715335 n=1 Tax=Eurytemora carolleeae TaxID=1294199 RepID=UPI000C75C851|nr:uncharacterized protein LOC111715335 [Eurytemora carolleeae]|eukprot:XP_023346424.1 uncharacterized protein LOC111715335 [Eurytemora affinis]